MNTELYNTEFYDALNEVLATSRYDLLTGRRMNLGEIIAEWFGDLLYRLFSRAEINVSSGQQGYNLNIISFSFVVIAIILVVVAGVVFFRTFRGRRKVQQYDLSDIFEELAKKNYTVQELIYLSENTDNMRLSVRYRYIAVLLAMNEKQIIEIKPSATNALIKIQIKTVAPALLPSFELTADSFHRAWFGYKEIDQATYGSFKNAVENIISGDIR